MDESASPAAPEASPEPDTSRVRDLTLEAGRAELHAGGLIIDVGSHDMHKYSRGGWMSGWGRNHLDGESTVAKIEERQAWLDVVTDQSVSEIVLRARGRGKLGVAFGKGSARQVSLTKDFALHRIELPKALPPGRHRLKLVGRKSLVDWVWLSEKAGQEPPSLQRRDRENSGLLAGSDSRYRFHLIPGEAIRLRVRVSGEEQASIRVSARRDGKEEVVLFEGKPGAGEQSFDLQAFAGHPTRLEFSSRGGKVSWQELSLVEQAGKQVTPGKSPKNVIVLLIDTQRADSFSVVGEGDVGAAAFESLVKTSTTFENAYNNENWTKPSIATIDTGLYPTSHGARWRKDKCSTDLVFLSEHLQKQGFATAALVSNISAGPKFGFDQGWDKFEKTDNAQHAFGRALSWLDARPTDKPFFLYVQTIDPHVPFSVPQGSAEEIYGGEYKGVIGPSFEQSEEDALNAGSLKLKEADARWLQALYDAEVLYHDEHLGNFLEGLRSRGTLDDTAFVILNDHGEEFGEQGRWGHGWTMGDALFRSPLLMHFPGFFPVETVKMVVEHVDVAPTIVESLGLPAMDAAEGRSLLSLLRKDTVAGLHSALLFGRPKQRAIRVGDYKLLLQSNRAQKLIHMPSDAAEATDISGSHPIAHRLCELALGEAIANPKKSERLADRSEIIRVQAQYIKE